MINVKGKLNRYNQSFKKIDFEKILEDMDRRTTYETVIVSDPRPTVNTDECSVIKITAQAEPILSMSDNLSGNPKNMDIITFWMWSDGIGETRAINWGDKFGVGNSQLVAELPGEMFNVRIMEFVFSDVSGQWMYVTR